MLPFMIFVVAFGLAHANQCSDMQAACRSQHFTPYENARLPSQRCDAFREWYSCLLTIAECKNGQTVDTTEPLTGMATVCYESDDGPCNDYKEGCRAKYEAVLDSDPIRACARAWAWVSCLTDPEVVYVCGAKVPKDLLAIRDDRCYSHLPDL